MWITIWCMITVWPVNLSVSRAREGSAVHDSRVYVDHHLVHDHRVASQLVGE